MPAPCPRKLTALFLLSALFLCFSVVSSRKPCAAPADRTVAILRDPRLKGQMVNAAEKLARALKDAGFETRFLTAEQAVDPKTLAPEKFFLYVLPGGGQHPVGDDEALRKYVTSGGNLLVLGDLANVQFVKKYGDRWANPQDLVAETQPEHVLYTFDGLSSLDNWRRATNDPPTPGGMELVDGGPNDGGKCAKIWTENLTGWQTFYAPRDKNLFPGGHQLLTFRARGDGETSHLLVEIDEEDGSRWMAPVPITDEWSYKVLSPADFDYWSDGSPGGNPDGSNDTLQPENAVQINFGLAQSHLPVPDGPHTFWVDDIGTAPSPIEDLSPIEDALPHMEGIYPAYKIFPLEKAARVESAPGQTILDANMELAAGGPMVCPGARPQGQGIGNGRKWRWMALANAYDEQGRLRGTPIWMLLNADAPYAGSVFAGCGFENEPDLVKDGIINALVSMVERMKDGLCLVEGGSQKFSCWPEEEVKLGAKLTNFGRAARRGTVEISVKPSAGMEPLHTWQTSVQLAAGESETVDTIWKPQKHLVDRYQVKVKLTHSGNVVDTISHELGILRPSQADEEDFVTIKGNDFYVDGEKWYPVGINYWPLYVAGMDRQDYWAGWLKPRFYDPALVERDLRLMDKLGMNMVSIQLSAPSCIPNALDFLRRCRRHRIKVIGFLSGAAPDNFDESAVREYIETARLPQNPTLMAYDIIWEPGNWMFRKGKRDRWDDEWHDWLVERYGSIEHAEEDWDFEAPREDGRVTSPSTRQMKQDGPWRRMVAAYRRFMDDLMSRLWNRARRQILSIDPNHLITNRQGNILPQDFTLTATAKHVDFFCPEAYAIPHTQEGYNAAGFFNRYTHFVTRGKPIVWIEYGQSIIGRTPNYSPGTQQAKKKQADYHEMFYQIALEAGANGTAPWWWPGGYRVGEQSDYGIINPDGTPRPAGKLIREYSNALRRSRPYPAPTDILTIDRDAHPGGYWHITFNQGAEAYAETVKNGGNLGLKTSGTGTTSANTPLVAVGNTEYDGHNPPKYLNAEFNHLQIRNATGQFVEATDGTEIKVSADRPILARVSVGNLQEAKWLSPDNAGGEKGAVYLASTDKSDLDVDVPLPEDVPYLNDAEFGEFRIADRINHRVAIELRMMAVGRAWFGEKRTFTLVPAR